LINRKERIAQFARLTIFASLIFLAGCSRSKQARQFSGFFLANDSGVSHGGFEWAGEYTATLQVSGDDGHLALTLSAGLGDPLTKHQFNVSEFAEAAGNLSFKIEGRQALFVADEDDTIWNGRFNGYYSANNSDDLSEQMGALSIEIFSGFRPHYYVELRLKPFF